MKAKHTIESANDSGKPTLEPVNSPNPLPSIETLAMIAANVSDCLIRNPGELIEYAFGIWIGARERLRLERDDDDAVQTHNIVTDEWSKRLSLPQEFPASFDQFLTSVVATKIPADSMKRFRDFLKNKFGEENGLGRLTKLRSTGFTQDTWIELAEAYLLWWPTERSKIARNNRSKRGQKK